jgi:signal transduction histidine kinase
MINSKAIGLRYIIALTLIALFVSIVFAISTISHKSSVLNAKIINVSGRQRMLSKDIIALAYESFYHQDQIQLGAVGTSNQWSSDPMARMRYLEIVRLFERAHNALLLGDPAIEPSGQAGRIAYDIYFNGPHFLDKQTKEFLRAARIIASDVSDQDKLNTLQEMSQMSHSMFLGALDAVVDRIEEHATVQTNHMQRMELIFYICALLILLLEAIFIFWPSYKSIKQALKDKKILEDTRISLDGANTELEEFAYRTSHDLRGPLTSAIGVLNLTSKFIKSGETEKALQAIETTKFSLSALIQLVEDILVLTKTKNLEESLTDFSPTELIIEAVDKLSYMDNFDKVNVIRDLRFTKKIRTQKDRLNLIIENLISNAFKYQNPLSDEPFLRIVTYETGNLFILEVIDNGIGIPEDQQHKLFKMFSRFHPKISFGSGLGLYMIKKSADLLGGEMEYESTGNGSIFRFYAPIDPSVDVTIGRSALTLPS